MGPDETAKLKDWSDLWKATLRAAVELGSDSGLDLDLGITWGDIAIVDLRSSLDKTLDTHLPTTSAFGHLRYHHAISDTSELRVDASSSYRHDDGGAVPFLTRRQAAEGHYAFSLTRQRIVTGLLAERTQADSSYLGRDRPRDDLLACYVQDQVQVTDRTTLTLGARYDKHTDLAGRLSPRGTLAWILAEGHQVRIGVGAAFRKPSFVETWARSPSGSNPAVSAIVLGMLEVPGGKRRPEKILSSNLDYQGQLRADLLARVNLFQNDVRDGILLRKVQPYPPYLYAVVYSNVQDIRIRGGEAELRWMSGSNLHLFLNGSFQDVDYRAASEGDRLSVPRWKGNLGGLYRLSNGLAGSLVVRRVGERDAQFGHLAPDGSYRFMRIPAVTTVDVSLTYARHLGPTEVELRLLASNLFDEEHIEYPIWDGRPAYFGWDTPEENYTESEKREYENRNALNDRRIVVGLTVRF